jgi:hypothetical protein
MTRTTLPPEKRLGVLAMEFRGARDETARRRIADSYSLAVEQLIKSRKWPEIPPLEDQLPDEWMPTAFFEYWSLRPPTPRAGRKG